MRWPSPGGVWTRKNPRAIARSLKRSAERSHARKSAPLRSAISMLTFYINRAGSGLSATQRRTLEAAKGELRKLFGKDKDDAGRVNSSSCGAVQTTGGSGQPTLEPLPSPQSSPCR